MGHFSIIYRVFHKEWHFLGQNQLNFWKFTGWCINNGTFLVKIGQFFKKRAIHKFRKLSSKHKFTSESQKIFDFLRNTSSQAFFDYHFSKTLVYKHFLSPFFFSSFCFRCFFFFIIKFLWPILYGEKMILRFSIFWMNQKILSIFWKILSLKIFTSVLTHFVWEKNDFEIFNFLNESEDSEHFLKNSIFENFYKCFDSFCMWKNWFWDLQFSGWIRRFWEIFEKFHFWKKILSVLNHFGKCFGKS